MLYLKKLLKFILCGGGAFATALFLFYIMSALISNKQSLKNKARSTNLIDFIRTKPPSFLDERRRVLPKKKPKAKPLPRLPLANAAKPPSPNQLKMDLPDLKSSLKGRGPALGGGMHGGGGEPLLRINPQYPVKAQMHGTEGVVVLQFSITPAGTVTDIKVLSANPPGIFERAAIRALRKWKYRPLIEDGKAVKQTNQTTQINFKMK